MKRINYGSEVLHINFNQDYSCVAVGTRTGLLIYNIDPIEVRFKYEDEGVGIVEMLNCTSLLAIVGSGDKPGSSPRKFILWNIHNNDTVCTIHFNSTVLSVRMNKQRLVICLETEIHVYDLASMECLHVLATAQNPDGQIALSSEASCYMAFPTENVGSVVLYDCLSLRLLSQIYAHKNAVVAMAFNREGTMLATASSTGTMIRLFSIPTGNHLVSLRRGSRSARIYGLCFSPLSDLLAAASSSGTVHVFSLTAALSGSAEGAEAGAGAAQEAAPGSTPGAAGGGGGGNWQETLASGTMTALSMAQTWSISVANQLHVLPEPMQEYARSTRAVACARVPSPSLAGPGHSAALASGMGEEGKRPRARSGSWGSSAGSGPGGRVGDMVPFQAAIVPVGKKKVATTAAESAMDDKEGDGGALKIVVITSNRHIFRYNLPEDIHHILGNGNTNDSREGPYECPLDDEAFLE